MRRSMLYVMTALVMLISQVAAKDAKPRVFNPDKDFVSLHYDHAADRDDGHSAAADRTMLESLYGRDWVKQHVVPVSGAYGKNGPTFVKASDAVMNAVWNDCGGWLKAHVKHDEVVTELTRRWEAVLKDGGDIWIKEGGQSDITAVVVKAIQTQMPGIDVKARIHLVQHSKWNENNTGDDALAFVKRAVDYIKIRDANNYLNIKGGDAEFQKAALAHPVFGKGWKAAFDYYDPGKRLDFSDTGELMRILGLG